MAKTMRLVFKGGAVLDVPLAQDADVTATRSQSSGVFTGLAWKNAKHVSMLSVEPTELAAVLVFEGKL